MHDLNVMVHVFTFRNSKVTSILGKHFQQGILLLGKKIHISWDSRSPHS